MFNPTNHIAVECTREHRNRLLEEAHRFRLANQVLGSKPNIYTRTTLTLGDLFINLGEWLKQRSAPKPAPQWRSKTI